MKLFKNKEVKLKSWRDITLSQGIELSQLDIDDSWELITNQMSIIQDLTMDEIENQPAALIYEFIHDYNFIKDLPLEKKLDNFKFDGVEYKLVDFSKMTLAQMIDIEEYYKMGIMENLHKILSVLYLPIKNKGFKKEIQEYIPDVKREEMFLNMNMEDIWGTTLFFYRIGQVYIKGLTDYLKVEEKKMMNQN